MHAKSRRIEEKTKTLELLREKIQNLYVGSGCERSLTKLCIQNKQKRFNLSIKKSYYYFFAGLQVLNNDRCFTSLFIFIFILF